MLIAQILPFSRALDIFIRFRSCPPGKYHEWNITMVVWVWGCKPCYIRLGPKSTRAVRCAQLSQGRFRSQQSPITFDTPLHKL
jgi:hypothetical protein